MTDRKNPYLPGEQQPGSQPEPPQFGQRSENWQENPAPTQGAWPVYQPGQSQQPQAPYSAPSYGAPPPGGPNQQYPQPSYGGVNQDLPGRGWPIFTLVAGAVAMIIIAPAILISMVLSSVDFSSLVDGSVNTYNGGEVVVDSSESIVVVAQGSQDPNSCTLTQGSTEIVIYQESSTGLVSGNAIPTGTYTIQCDIPEGAELFVFGGDQMAGMFSGTVTGLIWSSIVGVLGLAALIVGIVWLVRRNRTRREILRTQWGAPQP